MVVGFRDRQRQKLTRADQGGRMDVGQLTIVLDTRFKAKESVARLSIKCVKLLT